MDVTKLVKIVREIGCGNFEELASRTYTNNGLLMIEFFKETLHTRKINDWGRDQDTDRFIGLDEKGWIVCRCKINWGAGPLEIESESVDTIGDEEIVSLFNNDLNLTHQLYFLKKCINIREKYSEEFDKKIFSE